ncbi:hypothetical protein IAR55_004738 [Kwoniella newhampshirensis]|uniref:Uncharacterized protein n=1 Tax=Kwoniella newhampshirensis TaxID=1651941 RepID=A0AAW0YJ31_9TREE
MSIPQPRPTLLPPPPPNLLATEPKSPGQVDPFARLHSDRPQEKDRPLSSRSHTSSRPIPVPIQPEIAATCNLLRDAESSSPLPSTMQVPILSLPQPLVINRSSPRQGENDDEHDPTGGGDCLLAPPLAPGSYAPNSLRDLRGSSLGGGRRPLKGFEDVLTATSSRHRFGGHASRSIPIRPVGKEDSDGSDSITMSNGPTLKPKVGSEDGCLTVGGENTVRALDIPNARSYGRNESGRQDEATRSDQIRNVISPSYRYLPDPIKPLSNNDQLRVPSSFSRKVQEIEQELRLQASSSTPSSYVSSRPSSLLTAYKKGERMIPRDKGRGKEGIDEVEVEWCFFCGKENERDLMELKEVCWKGQGDGDAGWQWVCSDGCEGGGHGGFDSVAKSRRESSHGDTGYGFERSEAEGWTHKL